MADSDDHDSSDTTSNHASSSSAPFRSMPRHLYASIEYPGPVSHPSALLRVIAQDDINDCLNAPKEPQSVLEVRYREGVRAAVPVKGHRIQSQKLLVKVVRKKRRKRADGHTNGRPSRDLDSSEGIFTTEIVGHINQTVRFRCESALAGELTIAMADWQYTPNPDGEVADLVNSLLDLDCEVL
jgi:general transcription factor 3C polypeptide 5 (transcription factor C subunit 1)